MQTRFDRKYSKTFFVQIYWTPSSFLKIIQILISWKKITYILSLKNYVTLFICIYINPKIVPCSNCMWQKCHQIFVLTINRNIWTLFSYRIEMNKCYKTLLNIQSVLRNTVRNELNTLSFSLPWLSYFHCGLRVLWIEQILLFFIQSRINPCCYLSLHWINIFYIHISMVI